MSYTNLLYHSVFSTKDRRRFISADIKERFYEYIGGAIRGEGGVQLEIGGVADHVHILAKFPPAQSVSKMMQQIKAGPSGWAGVQFPDWPGWQTEYAAFTVSESQVEAVREYIRNQEEHHKTMSFRDELIALLRKNNIEFDERYLQ
ncbi:MAG: IS200/IS605 family transposase [Phycisphaerae bacterium]|nr:IS200/IS605 family transposase [Phycisphaerae bacterium]